MTVSIDRLAHQLDRLTAEADIRKLQARYMYLCDTPCPEPGVDDDATRIDRIVGLYTEDAVWEGVGAYYDGQFGRSVGRDAIRKHFEGFWGQKRDPALVLNVHYLTTEDIHVDGDEAHGHWVHMQPWVFSDGKSLLRSSRLWNRFRRVDGRWFISRTRTENVFVAPLAPGWAESVGATSVLMRRPEETRAPDEPMRTPSAPNTFADRALAEIDGLHRVLQRWFRAEGAQDPALVLAHFDPAYTMVTTAGKLLTFDMFRGALPGFWGSRPGLVMEITGETLVQSGPGFATLTYRERQTLAGAVTDRFSTVLMTERDGTPVWRHLQETMIA